MALFQEILLVVTVLIPVPLICISCEMTMTPEGRLGVLVGDCINIVCNATGCKFHGLTLEDGDGTTIMGCSGNTESINCPISITKVQQNGSQQHCNGLLDQSVPFNSSLVLLVQDSLNPVTDHDLVISKSNDTFLNISWGPVFAYEGLIVYYNISFNGTICTTTDTNIEVSTTGMDLCQFTSVYITPFIKTADQMLIATTRTWNIPTEIPPDISKLNYTMILKKNSYALLNIILKFNLTKKCDCPGRTNDVFIMLNDVFNASVVSDTNCIGYATFILPPDFSIDAEIVLQNDVGSSSGGKNISFDASPFTDTDGHITCYFIDDDFMIANNYSTSCVIYHVNMSQPVYAIREKNMTVSVSFNIMSSKVFVSSHGHISIESGTSTPICTNTSSVGISNGIFSASVISSFAAGIILGCGAIIIFVTSIYIYKTRATRAPNANLQHPIESSSHDIQRDPVLASFRHPDFINDSSTHNTPTADSDAALIDNSHEQNREVHSYRTESAPETGQP